MASRLARMMWLRPAGQAQDGAPGVHVPVGRAQAGEGGHHINAGGILHLGGEVLGVRRFGDEVQLVPQPLDHRTAHENAALQSVLHLAVDAHRDGGEQAVLALVHPLAGVHQQEAAGAVGVLGLARLKAGLAEEGGLLVARDARDGHFHPLDVHMAVDLAAALHLGQHVHGDAQPLADGLVPAQVLDVIEHGAAGVGVVGHVHPAAGELPDEPGVHGAE